MGIKSSIKRYTPTEIWKVLHNSKSYIGLRSYFASNKKAEKRVRNKKGALNVLFFAMFDSQWKYDSLYELMLKDKNFNPLIIVCPCTIFDREYMTTTMNKCCQYFDRKGFAYIKSYDEATESYIDAHQYNPDIIFYTNPYPGHIDDKYYRDQYLDALSCYSNYFYVAMRDTWTCALDFHKILWRYYIEYPLLLSQINDTCFPYKVNGRIAGYPLFDIFRQYKVSDKDWPLSKKPRKRIIWATHHTISGKTQLYAMATFERYYDFMLQMAEKYKNEIEIVFKPHPLLKPNLYEVEGWGRERTDAYYEKWAKGENTAFVDGEYVGLFLASDAMIHDCNSFTVEYLAVNKPAMFLDSGLTDDKINEVGKEARACYYKGYCEEDIENFIKMIIEGGEDELKERREAFYKNYILPPNGKLAAENIIDDLLTSLGRK